jgi:carboxylesterase type B
VRAPTSSRNTFGAQDWGVEYGAEELGCPAGPGQIEAMRQVSVAKILETTDSDSATDFYESCIDGYVKHGGTAHLLAAGEFNRVPLMIGYTGDDGLGSDELEHHMFELENLDVAKYKALLAREFGAAHLEEALSYFPINESDDDAAVDVQLAALSRQLWYDASSWIMAKEMASHSCPAWFYMFDEKVPTRWGGGKKSFHGADVPFCTYSTHRTDECHFFLSSSSSSSPSEASAIAMWLSPLERPCWLMAAGHQC